MNFLKPTNSFKASAYICLLLFLFLLVQSSYPLVTSSMPIKVEQLFREGVEFYRQGEYSKAIIKFSQVEVLTKDRKTLGNTYFYLSLCYFALGEKESAKEQIKKTLAINPSREVSSIFYSPPYVELFNQVKEELGVKKEKLPEEVAKKKVKEVKRKEEEKPKVKVVEKKRKKVPAAEVKPEEVKKKRGKGFLYVLGGLIIAGGGLAAYFLLKPKYGTIEVSSSPSGARVYLNNSDTGKTTSCTLTDLSPGTYTVKLLKEGYRDYSASVSVEAGKTSTVNANLSKHTIKVTNPKASTLWSPGDKVVIKWTTDASLAAVSNIQTKTGINNSISNKTTKGFFQPPISAFSNSYIASQLPQTGRKFQPAASPKATKRVQNKRSYRINNSFPTSHPSEKSTNQSPRKTNTSFSAKRNNKFNTTSQSPSLSLSTDTAKTHYKMHVAVLSKVKIELYKGTNIETAIASSTENDGSFNWTVSNSLPNSSNYKVRVSCATDSGIYGESEKFRIEKESITITEPTSSTLWTKGNTAAIKWTSTGTIENVKIDLYEGGNKEKTIISSTNNDGTYNWTVPTSISDSSDYKVRISNASNSNVYGESPNFKIAAVPSAPSNLVATPVSSSQINLAWHDNSNNENGFKIERRGSPTSTWHQIHIQGANVKTFSDTGLESGKTYYYRIRAFNEAGDSDYSNEASATTLTSTTIFEENWNNGIIDTNEWNFVDPSHEGHKASIFNGELFINAWDDWGHSCGIISKKGFSYNTKLTVKFRIHRVRDFCQFETILGFQDSGELDQDGYTTGKFLFSLCGGNENNRELLIRDKQGNKYMLGNYTPDQNYILEIDFLSSETIVKINGKEIIIHIPYPRYHIHFGGQREDSYFDDLRIQQY